ncbi:hypothetical protein GQ53DRAFT_887450 [Thozetella sp. PMI_491]|nr:hypothetical protein GQ53DRAFT_887450 [Thozetella sp. PMI_491]
MADILIGNYLRTFETIHRIVHVPTFRREYELLWDESTPVSTDFIIQVQLCCALGALVYDEEFSLRPQAMQWVQEAGAWLESSAKPRLIMSTIQTICLHRIARESMQGTYGDRVWILSRSIIRSAMSISLHRDSSKLPGLSRAQAEMCRRLWTTILELALGSCLDPGAAPLISLEDFDCSLPFNFDDVQLNLDVDDNPQPQSLEQHTDSSFQIALESSLPIRLAIAKFSTGLKAGSYQEALRLSDEYSCACRSLSSALRALRPSLSECQRQYCEMLMYRYIFTLNIPYMVVGSKSPAYMLSRKACIDAAVNLAHSSLPLASTQEPLLATIRTMNMAEPQGTDFVRLWICGSGPFRTVLFQAVMVIAAELLASVDESNGSFRWSMGLAVASSPLYGDMRALELLSLLRVAAQWTIRRMRAGQETNKDHFFVALAIASIDALMKGMSVKEAMEGHGKVACLEYQTVLEALTVGASDGELSEQLSPEDDMLGFDDMWFIQPGNFDLDLQAYQV